VSVRGLRRAVFILVLGALVGAVPVSALASDNLLRGDVRQAETAFNQSLTDAIRGGFDPTRADQLMWRYSQVAAFHAASWWQAPVVEHSQLDKLAQLQADLHSQYQQQVAESRDALQRELHRWTAMMGEAQKAGVSASGLDSEQARFANYAALATTPIELTALGTVVSDQYTILNGRLAAYRTARAQADAAVQSDKTLLATASQYPQLTLAAYQTQVATAEGGLSGVHDAADFSPIVGQLQQVGVSVQALLDARTAAYNQLAATRSTLGTAQSIGASIGNAVWTINNLAAQLGTAADQGTFQSIAGQLYQQKQNLATAIFAKQQSPVSYNGGAGKVIVISLSRQVLTAYQDGTAVLTTFVATGRPALPTPPGTYHIFARYSPYKFISPWPYGSQYWYPSSWTSFAMEFAGGGYFIHDAPWRTWYGPGSNIYNGTHGCVNVPYSPMAFLWNWTPIGTTVVVQY
jgi:lipoprotein-anchoring transpeptidase ErfK/SrfK